MNKEIEAFILTGSNFEANSRQNIRLYAKSNEGPILIEINNFQNYFFVESQTPTNIESLDGHFVTKVDCHTNSDLKNKVEAFRKQRLRIYESDIKIIDRYLMDNEFYAQIKIKGEAKFENGHWVFRNPEVFKSDYYPTLSVFSFDIETGKDGRILSLSYNFREKEKNISEAIVLGDLIPTEHVKFAKTETEILDFFEKRIQNLNPDVVTGWNVIGFDLNFLIKKSKQLNRPLIIGKNKRELNSFESGSGDLRINIEGRVIIDGPRALKMNFFNFESYSLNHVAKELLSDAKDIDEDEVHDKWAEIERRFREDKFSLAKYNIKDSELVLDIFEKIKIIDLFLNRSLISGMLLERVGGSTAAFDHFFLPDLHKEGVVALNTEDVFWNKQGKGGYVLTPVAGLYDNVLVMDFKSLYPTVIRTFFIDPLSNFKRQIDPVNTPIGLSFSKTKNILPHKIEELLEKRAFAKKEKNTNLSQAVKILMNSFYGVMGSDGCRFYHENLPDAVTGTGQWILKTVKEFLESKNLAVLYGDTDSIFVKINDAKDIEKRANDLTQEINHFLNSKIRDEFHTESHLEIQFDKFFKKFILTQARGMDEGAKKRYAGLKITNTQNAKTAEVKVEEEIIITGMEYVRSDWSKLARNFQYELIRRIFYNEDLVDFIQNTINDLENKKLDDQLVLSKRLTKPLEEYVKNVPPHARAAKILYEELGILNRRPKYVMTKNGPIPIELLKENIDYDYYIDRQLGPIADSVLTLIGKKFDEYRNGQLSLF